MKKTNIILISIGIIIIILGTIILLPKNKTDDIETPRKTNGLTIVPTMQDEITADSAWAGTFQLIWNDLMDEIVKGDVVFNPQESMVINLNKQNFNKDMLSDSYYYKKYGLKTLELKAEIEKAIKEKFNQESDILDLFDWDKDSLNDPNDPNIDRYFFYVMLYRNFEYLKEFNKLETAKFGKHSNISYFGINDSSSNEVRNQIEVLYYNSENDFALIINTKTNDEVIFYKNPKGNTFEEIYENMKNEISKYNGDKTFNKTDKFKAPNIKFNEIKEYEELANKPFKTEKGEGEIIKAIQTIQFHLDEKGGEIKSEAGIDMNETSSLPNDDEVRNFYVDNTFAIFLREKGADIPYFAARIDDITKFQ